MKFRAMFLQEPACGPAPARARGPATRIAGAAKDASEGVPAPPP